MTGIPPGGIAILDTETVTLDPGPDVIWEVAIIVRGTAGQDHEWLFQLAPNMNMADEAALRVSGFRKRYVVPDGVEGLAWTPVNRVRPTLVSREAAARSMCHLLTGRHVVGVGPWFDTQRLELLFAEYGLVPGWHYHLLPAEALAIGWLRAHGHDVQLPFRSDAVALALGVPPPTGDTRHTALGDARWARDIYDKVMA